MITFLFWLSLIVFTLGLCGIMFVYRGIPQSVSDSYYLLPKKIRIPVFYGWILLVAVPLMISWLEVSDGQSLQFLVFLACAGLCFVGAAGDYKQSLTKEVHVGGALVCVISSILWVFIYTKIWPFTFMYLLLFTLFGLNAKGIVGGINGPKQASNSVMFFLELVAFLSAYLGIWTYL